MAKHTEVRSPSRAYGRLATGLGIVMLVLVAASYVVNAADRQVFFVVLPAISDELQFALASGGFLGTIFTLGIGVAGVPAGYVIDRLSRKTVMLIGIVIYSSFTLLTALAVGFFDIAVYRGLTGVGEAMQQAALFSAVGAYFYQRRAMALGTLNFAYGLGAFFGPLFGGILLDATGAWETPFYIYGITGFVFVAIILLVVPRAFTEQVDPGGRNIRGGSGGRADARAPSQSQHNRRDRHSGGRRFLHVRVPEPLPDIPARGARLQRNYGGIRIEHVRYRRPDGDPRRVHRRPLQPALGHHRGAGRWDNHGVPTLLRRADAVPAGCALVLSRDVRQRVPIC
jgi:hypothetical protein